MATVPQKALGTTHYHLPTLHLGFLTQLKDWLKAKEQVWEYYRLSIAATGIFIQVTAAGFMIAVLGAAGAPVLVYTLGIFFAFASNSLAFAQAPMRWVIFGFIVSTVVNMYLGIYYLLPLL